MENKKFFNFEGEINRRYFIINFLIVKIVKAVLFTTPLFIAFILNPDLVSYFLLNGNLPIGWNILGLIAGIIETILLAPSVLRRVRDIALDDSNYITGAAIVILAIIAGSILTEGINNIYVLAIRWSALIILILLMALKGKYNEKSEIVKFNWGAFLGTWIWGIFNRSYKTLFMIPLFFTMGSFYFSLICGLKGNEWSYKNNPKENIEKFHKNQSNQAICWIVLLPIISILSIALSFLCAGYAINKYQKTHPDIINKINNYTLKLDSIMAESNFSKIDIKDGNYSFYVNPKVWVKLSDNNRTSISDSAGSYVMIKKSIKAEKSGKIPAEVMKEIKIYSTFNNEVLAEFIIKGQDIEYKFNNHPSLP
ncbi:hypothetical protein J6G99_07375 [bacterium]|nr:hypothetical protein [bacterium]